MCVDGHGDPAALVGGGFASSHQLKTLQNGDLLGFTGRTTGSEGQLGQEPWSCGAGEDWAPELKPPGPIPSPLGFPPRRGEPVCRGGSAQVLPLAGTVRGPRAARGRVLSRGHRCDGRVGSGSWGCPGYREQPALGVLVWMFLPAPGVAVPALPWARRVDRLRVQVGCERGPAGMLPACLPMSPPEEGRLRVRTREVSLGCASPVASQWDGGTGWGSERSQS